GRRSRRRARRHRRRPVGREGAVRGRRHAAHLRRRRLVETERGPRYVRLQYRLQSDAVLRHERLTMEKFRGVDYYGIEALLSDEERMVRDAVRDWVEAEFLPVVGE